MPPTTIAELETPAPLVDVDRLARNLDRMAAYASRHGLALRPHVKTHKSPRVAAEQVARGAAGLTCATPRELETMAEVSDDLLLAHPPLGAKLDRVLRLPEAVRLTVAVDSVEALDRLDAHERKVGRRIGAYVELDVGMRRVGVGTPAEAVRLAGLASECPGVAYRGVTFYPGHIREHVDRQGDGLARLGAHLGSFLRPLRAAGLDPEVVSGGSTPTVWSTHEIEGMTEFRPGTYVYNDRTTAEVGACAWDDCALTVLATFVSTAVPGQAVIDAGSKALGREPLRAEGDGFGVLLGRPEVRVARMSEEHGILDLAGSEWTPEVGEQVRVIPNHVCIVVHLFDEIVGVRGEAVVETWPVAARGRGAAETIATR